MYYNLYHSLRSLECCSSDMAVSATVVTRSLPEGKRTVSIKVKTAGANIDGNLRQWHMGMIR
jgi:hypothetical protein